MAPEILTTLAYRSMSRRTKAANSSGLLPTASAPSAANCDWISGDRTTFTTASFKRAMMRCGVFAGANIPNQFSASKPGTPDSLIVGTSGS